MNRHPSTSISGKHHPENARGEGNVSTDSANRHSDELPNPSSTWIGHARRRLRGSLEQRPVGQFVALAIVRGGKGCAVAKMKSGNLVDDQTGSSRRRRPIRMSGVAVAAIRTVADPALRSGWSNLPCALSADCWRALSSVHGRDDKQHETTSSMLPPSDADARASTRILR
jgi:hypothetical protein